MLRFSITTWRASCPRRCRRSRSIGERKCWGRSYTLTCFPGTKISLDMWQARQSTEAYRYFCLTWRPHFRHLDLPPISDTNHRIATLNFIATAFSEEKTAHDADSMSPQLLIETAKFRLFETCEIGIEESYILKRIVRTSMANLVWKL